MCPRLPWLRVCCRTRCCPRGAARGRAPPACLVPPEAWGAGPSGSAPAGGSMCSLALWLIHPQPSAEALGARARPAVPARPGPRAPGEAAVHNRRAARAGGGAARSGWGAGPPRPLPSSVRASVSAPVALRPGAVGGRGARTSVLAPDPELAARGGHSVGPRGGSCLTGCAAGDAGLPSLLCCLVDYETPR